MTVDDLRESRESVPVKLKEFIDLYKYHNDSLFCFFEGEDSKYYDLRIRTYGETKDTQYINSKGKNEVLRLYQVISNQEEYSSANILYFIDRDYDEPLRNPKIYETPCYSIENFYTTLSAFSRIIKNEFGLNEIEQDYRVCIELFQKRQIEFHESTKLLNAWIACQKDISTIGNYPRLNLSNINLRDIIEIDIESVKQKYSITDIENIFPLTPKISIDKLNSKIEAFEKLDKTATFRGKFEIEFLRIFLERLMNERGNKQSSLFTTPKKTKLNLSKINIISELSQYADTPVCLIRYLSENRKIS